MSRQVAQEGMVGGLWGEEGREGNGDRWVGKGY